ncbi:hypothetical protein V6D01_10885 [Staphylococcus capitis subsp. urealyticus]|uniref:hypothetical protein n=1 Tax=Staphylococcus capitis TaxID=29388 RepID=UPI00345C149E
MENYKNKFKYVIICMFCIGVLALLSFLDFDNNSKKAPKSNENKQEKKIKSYTYKDIENMNDEEIKNLSIGQIDNLSKSARNLYDERANELYKNDTTKKKESYDNDEQYDNINNTELNSSIEQKISKSIHNLNVHSDEDVKKYEVTTEADSKGNKKPNVNIIIYLKGEFKGAAEFNDEHDIIKNYAEFVTSNFIIDRGEYGKQFNNIKIDFYYKDSPYAYTNLNVNEKIKNSSLLENDKINFY